MTDHYTRSPGGEVGRKFEQEKNQVPEGSGGPGSGKSTSISDLVTRMKDSQGTYEKIKFIVIPESATQVIQEFGGFPEHIELFYEALFRKMLSHEQAALINAHRAWREFIKSS